MKYVVTAERSSLKDGEVWYMVWEGMPVLRKSYSTDVYFWSKYLDSDGGSLVAGVDDLHGGYDKADVVSVLIPRIGQAVDRAVLSQALRDLTPGQYVTVEAVSHIDISKPTHPA